MIVVTGMEGGSMTEEEKATARVHLINAINWLECDGEEGMHIEEAVERIRLALAIIRPAETLSGAESGEELIDKILQEAQNLYKNDPDMTTEQSYRGAMRALLASRPAESAKTVPMEMLALLSCPFCGGRAERIDLDDDETDPNYGGSFIHCPACLASSKLIFGEKVGLEEAWNKRFASSAKGEADELLAQLAKIFEDEAEYRDMILWTPMNPRKEVRGLTRSDIENIFATSRVFSPMRDFLQSLAARQPESADGDLASALAIAANMQARAEQAESDLASERKYSAACARHRDEAEAASREAESGARALREALHLQAANISFLKKAIQAGDPKSKLILRCDDIASAALDGSAKEEER